MIYKGSFRDNKARIFIKDNEIYRKIFNEGANDFENIKNSAVIKNRIKKKQFIDYQEERFEEEEGVYKIIKHPSIKFITYPYEWCFEQLKTAALFHLEFQVELLNEGNNLKDGSAYNIQFINNKPIFIDFMSVEKYKEDEPWLGYKSFCEQFLYPLLIQSKTSVNTNEIFKGNLDGIPLSTTYEILNKFKNYFDTKVLFHVFLLHYLDTKYKKNGLGKKIKPISRTPENLIYQLKDLISYIKKLQIRKKNTIWANYSKDNFYGKDDETKKESFLKKILQKKKYRTICDFGCNDGRYSTLASDYVGESIVAIDNDVSSLNRCFENSKENNLNILNIQMDITNPSTRSGWLEEERESFFDRFKFDLIINFAVMHHIIIGKNIPMESFIEYLSKLSNEIILEFIPKDDEAIKTMLLNRKDIFLNYSEENLKKIFIQNNLKILDEIIVTKSNRKIFYLRKNDA